MRRILAVLAMSGALLVSVLAVPALAAGSFDWNGQFTNRLVSRTYTAVNTGNHTITKKTADCPGPGTYMIVRLVHERAFSQDDYFGWKTWDCTDNDQARTWTSSYTNEFHFDVEKGDTGETTYTWTVTGTTKYP